jgi:phage protein U
MFAILGDNIVFDVVKQPDALSDKRATNYAQQALVNGKPNLQATDEALIEFTMSVQFHFQFCNPEEEFLKLDNARKRREILPLIFGNGRNEGDFVITTIERTIAQTDSQGNFIEINCNITLIEFANVSTASRQLEQDKKNAFALSSNRPLPANTQSVPTNPALNVAQENQQVKYATNDIDDRSSKIENDVSLVTDIDPDTQLINKAQKFVDSLGSYIPKVTAQVAKANNAVGSVNSLISAYGAITTESPGITAALTAVTTALGGVTTQLTVLGSLPGTISNTTDANTALSAMTNTLVAVKTLKTNQEALNDASAPLAQAVATKKILT